VVRGADEKKPLPLAEESQKPHRGPERTPRSHGPTQPEHGQGLPDATESPGHLRQRRRPTGAPPPACLGAPRPNPPRQGPFARTHGQARRDRRQSPRRHPRPLAKPSHQRPHGGPNERFLGDANGKHADTAPSETSKPCSTSQAPTSSYPSMRRSTENSEEPFSRLVLPRSL